MPSNRNSLYRDDQNRILDSNGLELESEVAQDINPDYQDMIQPMPLVFEDDALKSKDIKSNRQYSKEQVTMHPSFMD